MKKNKKQSKKEKKIIDKKNLKIVNCGDVIVIRNRSVIAAGVSAFIILALFIACGVVLKDAWELPMFTIVFTLVVACVGYSFANILLNKIILDSPNTLMIVYNPFKKQYKFEEINYVDVKSSKAKDGIVLHTVTVYIGNGKRNVEIITTSSKQADELVALLRGMLDNGAMVFPEGDEEPFNFDDDKQKTGRISLGFKKNKNSESEDETKQLITKKNNNTEEASSVSKKHVEIERRLPVFRTDVNDNDAGKKNEESESNEPTTEQFILKDSVFDNEEKTDSTFQAE